MATCAGERPKSSSSAGATRPSTRAGRLPPAIEAGRLEATVVSRENFHVFHGFVGEMLTGRAVAEPHPQPGAAHLPAGERPRRRDPADRPAARKVVTTSRNLDGDALRARRTTTSSSALGSIDRFEAYPGLAEHAFKLKTYEDAAPAAQPHHHDVRAGRHREGPGGAQAAADVLRRRRRLRGHRGRRRAGRPRAAPDQARVPGHRPRASAAFVLVHPGPTILPELYGDDGSGAAHASEARRVRHAAGCASWASR